MDEWRAARATIRRLALSKPQLITTTTRLTNAEPGATGFYDRKSKTDAFHAQIRPLAELEGWDARVVFSSDWVSDSDGQTPSVEASVACAFCGHHVLNFRNDGTLEPALAPDDPKFWMHAEHVFEMSLFDLE